GVAVLVWILASVAFAFYVANFSSYNKTYGALAGVIVFLLWLWITNIALLFGAEFDSEAERARQLQSQAQGGLAGEVARLSLVTGALAATGPGLTITVDDAPVVEPEAGSDPRADTSVEDGRVLDQDLQSVVNGLWAVGAEAVSVNGQRLTALSAIRSAGQAILVDYRPLVPPYRVVAIGDATAMAGAFADSAAGRSLKYLADNFGIRYDVATSSGLEVPGSAGLRIRRAEPPASPPAAAPSTSASPTDEQERP
ncbi:MAG TPA: YhjD/YihY/BrkB family envelope integrity protein, partial [Actinomycetales bacterium]